MHLYLKLNINCLRKIHIIRVVFEDQTMYVGMQDSAKLGKKKVCFCHFTNLEKDIMEKL